MPAFLPLVWAWLKSAVSAVFSVFVKYPWQSACVVLLCATAWFWRADRQAKDALATFKAQTIAAQKDATAKALAQKQQMENTYAQRAREADSSLQSRQRVLDLAADTYVAHHRVRATAQGPASPTAPASESSSAESTDGPGPSPELVAVQADDVKICTDNTARLDAARDWALTLNQLDR